ncbi:class I SAM-dependent methyltransferase [Halomonas huangheensis]|uniref:Methyltransferase domain-containing protein n=1 Tax=Halomonas huangheensis TaxID=1178482 RepID=W1NCA9_9GAMM|nr:class I SAM-dependent methyltransferase [Halomonas huangheensis]ALM52952.1 SAM-dependent methyltransferase [Halomonas huangheensis]ERL53123.1 hypothetical protein BJB45_17765 [Halomonas huangheensis]
MDQDQLKALFDQQAEHYDTQWTKMAPINNGLYFLLESVFAELPTDARILCVGAGTGRELIHLANTFPGWHFTAVEPSGPMLDVCRQSAEAASIAARCSFHEGYLHSLPEVAPFDAATSFLVSQFILDKSARSGFFNEIATRLKPSGILANADLASDTSSAEYPLLLEVWQRVMSGANLSAEDLSKIMEAYARDVAILPPTETAAIMQSGGFETPVQFFQSGLIHAWFARRHSERAA